MSDEYGELDQDLDSGDTGEMEALSDETIAENQFNTAVFKLLNGTGLIEGHTVTDLKSGNYPEGLEEVNRSRREAIACVRRVADIVDPMLIGSLVDADITDDSGVKKDACMEALKHLVSSNGTKLTYELKPVSDPDNNPATLVRSGDQWVLRLDPSLMGDRLDKLPSEIFHEYSAWLQIVDAGVEDKESFPSARIRFHKDDGEVVEKKYASTHLMDMVFMNMVDMKKESD